MSDQKPPLSNDAAYQLGERVKTMFYKNNIKMDDVVKSLLSDPSLKGIDPEKIKRFAYSTLGALHELDVKTKEVKK